MENPGKLMKTHNLGSGRDVNCEALDGEMEGTAF